jgi:hypothetical protein
LDSEGWDDADNYLTIRFADLDGDQRADVCGRGNGGIFCALNTGTGFGVLSRWSTAFRNTGNGHLPQYYKTIIFKDIDGDKMADLCGRAADGYWCVPSAGWKFDNARVWAGDFSDANGWASPQYYETMGMADVNGDGLGDVCGRGSALWCTN